MQTALVLSVVAPTLIAAVLVGLGHRLWRKSAPTEPGRWSLALAPALAAFAAYLAVRGFPELPPTDASEWALWMGLVAAIFGVLEARLGLPALARWVFRVLASVATVYLVSKSRIDYAWDGGTTVVWLVGATAALVLVWTTIDIRAEALPGPVTPVALLVLGTGVATVIGLSGSALIAQACGGVTTAFGVMAVTGFLRSELRLSRSVAGPTTLLLGGLALSAFHYADVGGVALSLLVLAPLTLWVGVVAPLPARGIKAAVVYAALGAVLCGAALATTAAPSEPPADEATDDYDAYDY